MSDFTAVITGASRGIGAAVTKVFGENGGELVIGARDESALEDVAAELPATPVRVDVQDTESVTGLLDVASDELGEIDVLLPNAGIYDGPSGKTPLPEEPDERFEKHMAVNARGVFATIREAVPHLAEDASVLVPSGKPAREPTAGSGSYGVSKAAAEAIARGFSADLEQVVGVIDPGQVQTALTEKEHGRTPVDVAPMYLWAAREAPADAVDGAVTGIKEWLRATR